LTFHVAGFFLHQFAHFSARAAVPVANTRRRRVAARRIALLRGQSCNARRVGPPEAGANRRKET
jgi:hypothetical protein